MKLKYGMNPYQTNAEIGLNDHLQILNGNPSFINFLDGLNAWQLVKELSQATGLPAAASFKHVTPSGAAVAGTFLPGELNSYNFRGEDISPLCSAYLKARGSDRLASFGDFIALSGTVDEATAKLIGTEVSDGIIAPGYEPSALEILKRKKKGAYCILSIDKDYVPPASESREIFGFRLIQDRNNLKITRDCLNNVKTAEKTIDDAVITNLLAGMITLKYTQSNSLAAAYNGHVIGIGSGQQSRILCSKLALSKAYTWYQKTKLDYPGIAYPRDNMSKTDKDIFHDELRAQMRGEISMLGELPGLCLCSDGFFPQTDNIELAHAYGVKYIASPMGSIRDPEIIKTCDSYGMVFIDTGVRLFHH